MQTICPNSHVATQLSIRPPDGSQMMTPNSFLLPLYVSNMLPDVCKLLEKPQLWRLCFCGRTSGQTSRAVAVSQWPYQRVDCFALEENGYGLYTNIAYITVCANLV